MKSRDRKRNFQELKSQVLTSKNESSGQNKQLFVGGISPKIDRSNQFGKRGLVPYTLLSYAEELFRAVRRTRGV